LESQTKVLKISKREENNFRNISTRFSTLGKYFEAMQSDTSFKSQRSKLKGIRSYRLYERKRTKNLDSSKFIAITPYRYHHLRLLSNSEFILEKPSTIKKLWLGLRVFEGKTNFEDE